ncbi:hypothetical protein L9F63_011661, partial [Diploptera punctata]
SVNYVSIPKQILAYVIWALHFRNFFFQFTSVFFIPIKNLRIYASDLLRSFYFFFDNCLTSWSVIYQ